MASNENMYNEYFKYFDKMNELYQGYIKGIERTNQLYTESIKNVDKMNELYKELIRTNEKMNELYREIQRINLEWLNAFWKPWLAKDWTKYERKAQIIIKFFFLLIDQINRTKWLE